MTSKTGILIQNMTQKSYSNPNQLTFVRKPNQSKSTALWQDVVFTETYFADIRFSHLNSEMLDIISLI